jgi:hypothetical protein
LSDEQLPLFDGWSVRDEQERDVDAFLFLMSNGMGEGNALWKKLTEGGVGWNQSISLAL